MIIAALLAGGVASSAVFDGLDYTLALVTLVLLLWRCVPRTRP